MTVFLIVALVIGLVFIFWAIGIYNGLVRMRNAFKNSFAQIDVQLKRRYELIPNLVETAKGYMKHERDTLERVIAARNQAFQAEQKLAGDPSNSAALKDFQTAESQLTAHVGKFMAVMEAYPDLKANTTMNNLMEELTSTENKVGFARQAFNDAVMTYNNQREVFPNILFANFLGFQAAELLQVESPEERKAVKVSFS